MSHVDKNIGNKENVTFDINEEVKLVFFDSKWRLQASREIQGIRKSLGRIVVGIEHHGSTSIPGMSSKPVIDILMGVRSLELSDRTRTKLKVLGYTYVGKRVGQERLYLTKRGKRNFNLGIVLYGDALWRSTLVFREYLRCHPKEAAFYEGKKREILARGATRLFEYTDAKSPWIERIARRADRWRKVQVLKEVVGNKNSKRRDLHKLILEAIENEQRGVMAA